MRRNRAQRKNDENVEKAGRDDGCSGKPTSLGMQASDHLCLQEADGYVDAVMSSQVCREVNAPFVINSNRKRHLSLPEEGAVKKLRNDSTEDNVLTKRNTVKAKRALNLKQNEQKDEQNNQKEVKAKTKQKESNKKSKAKPKKRDSDLTVVEADVHCDGKIEDDQVPTLIRKLSSDMHAMHANTQKMMNELNERMVSMERDLEKKITTNITKTVDKRITTEMTKMRKEIDSKVQSAKDEFMTDLNNMAEDIRDLTRQVENSSEEKQKPELNEKHLALNIAVRNVGEKPRENVKHEVNRIIKDGIVIYDVEVSKAERRLSSDNKPGVIIATFHNTEDKKKAMERKKNLKSTHNFSKIFIHHDQSRGQRRNSRSLKVLVDALKSGKAGHLSVRGASIIMAEESTSERDEYSDAQGRRSNENRNFARNTDKSNDYRKRRDSGHNNHRNEERRGRRRNYNRDRPSSRYSRLESDGNGSERNSRDRRDRDFCDREDQGRDRYNRDMYRGSYYQSSGRNNRSYQY